MFSECEEDIIRYELNIIPLAKIESISPPSGFELLSSCANISVKITINSHRLGFEYPPVQLSSFLSCASMYEILICTSAKINIWDRRMFE